MTYKTVHTVPALHPGVCPSCTFDIEPGMQIIKLGGEWFHIECQCKVTDKPKRDCPHCQERLRSEDAGQKAPYGKPSYWRAKANNAPSVPAKRETWCDPCRRKIRVGENISPNAEGVWIHTGCL